MNRAARCIERGLTLIEMLVVVVILATIAQTALVSAERLVDEDRYERTVDALEHAEVAILGRRACLDPSGKLWGEGFVADVGRLPIVRTNTPSGREVDELWVGHTTITPFSLQNAPGDSQVRLPCGWRGPYLELGIGRTEWFDGWGEEFRALEADGTPAQIGDAIERIESLGADALDDGDGYAKDLELQLSLPTARRHVGSIPVRVEPMPGGGGQIVVRVYGPEHGALVTLVQQVIANPGGGSVQTVLTDVSVGPRVVRAYQIATPPTSKELPVGGGIAGAITPVVVVYGGIPEIVFDLADP